MKLSEILDYRLAEMAEGKARDTAVEAGVVLAKNFMEWAREMWEHNPLVKKKYKSLMDFVLAAHDWRGDFVNEFIGTVEKSFDVTVRDLARK